MSPPAWMVMLDTNVVGAFLKPIAPLWLDLYRPVLETSLYAVSVQTEAELRRWALRARWGTERWSALDDFLRGSLILPADRTVAEAWARLMMHAESRGRALMTADAWVAATAMVNDLPLVTHDKDMAGLEFPGLEVVCRA